VSLDGFAFDTRSDGITGLLLVGLIVDERLCLLWNVLRNFAGRSVLTVRTRDEKIRQHSERAQTDQPPPGALPMMNLH
jgi:hypothetical protein